MAELARSIDNFMASKTCDATTEPTMQADPLEAQTPSRSSAISIVSESKSEKLTFSVFVSRRFGSPFCFAAGNLFSMRVHNSSRNCASRFCSVLRSPNAHSAAAAMPAIAATFSVPGRR